MQPKLLAHKLSRTLLGVTLPLALLSLASTSAAVQTFTATTGAEKNAKTKKPTQSQAPKPPTDKGSGENKGERDKRMLRECKGRPNAGACEGYAS